MKEYLITTGDLFFKKRNPLSGHITMRDEVDHALLQEALKLAAKRLPFIAAEMVSHDGRTWLRESGLPPVAVKGDRPPQLGVPESNMSEFSFACKDKVIMFQYNHMVVDGHGFGIVFGTVLYYYCKLRYGEALRFHSSFDPEASFDDAEYADPFSYVTAPERPAGLMQPDAVFTPPDRDLSPSPQISRLYLPKEALLRVVKSLSGSPGTFMALMLCRALDSVYPVSDEPIVSIISADVRSVLGCRRTAQNCLSNIVFVYSERLKKMPLERQMICFRGMLIQQTDPDYIMQTVNRRKGDYEAIVRARLEGRICAAAKGAASILVSYVGNVGMGELDKYCGMLVMESMLPGPLSIGMTEETDLFSVDLVNQFNHPDVFEAFLHELNVLDIPYEA